MSPTIPLIELPVEEACHAKWARGRKEYGPEFVGDPLLELYDEAIDSLNYCDECERRGLYMVKIRERLLEIVALVRLKYGQR